MKHLHMTLAVLSISLFTIRFFWTLVGSAQLEKKWVKVSPHVIDTMLLLVGVALNYSVFMEPF